MYTYAAEPSKIVDGDTVRMKARQAISWPDENIAAERVFVVRLLGIDCPEMRGATREAGLAATAYVRTLLYDDGDLAKPKACEVTMESLKDVYGRWLGGISVEGQDLAWMIVEAGHGVAKNYSRHRATLTGMTNEGDES